ncbi:AcrR family transcriptional regulator [Actinoalloteichus hoggarensis]|uniref:DNA-binding transcriptional regulator EnvR n=1 Tax=Actinoalloteichus hoggarensis TaxID=1470176 RepID=A0A221W9D0_9PSEU|nr:TetR/AcrR family transcriptional regulator [Actinoalloteichus hoggarensis]ASO22620.1 DNA-binding transcriptional regulator EnvR [Actinoalloteichus hoggarensis]MBB5922953.1 AcrR family transcriptional regulator [Actinoalloteichus hoggarensis]
MAGRERADAARNRQAILDAAATLFATSSDPLSITMNDIAAEAGVGKGTLFRRFGDRAGLLNAVYATRIGALHDAVATGPPPLGPGTPPSERVVAVLDALVEFKLHNRQVALALEHLEPGATNSCLDTPNYRNAHTLFAGLLTDVVGADQASWAAHALLAYTRIDLLGHLITAEGWSAERVRDQIGALAARILAR